MTTKAGRPRIPTTLRELSPAEAAWVAGVIEGEGSIHSATGSLDVWNNDRELLERLRDLTGVGRLYEVPLTAARRASGSRAVSYRWIVSRKADLAALYPLIRPWMMPRRAAAIRAAQDNLER